MFRNTNRRILSNNQNYVTGRTLRNRRRRLRRRLGVNSYFNMSNMTNALPRQRLIRGNMRNIRRNANRLPVIPISRNITNRELSNQLNIQRATTVTPVNVNTTRGIGVGKTLICNREFFGNITSGINYFNLKPGYSGMVALDYQALGFDNYKMLTAEVEFRSSMASSTNGRVVMTIDYEGNPPSTVNEIMASDMSKTTNVYKNTTLTAKPGSLMKQKLHAVSHNTEDENQGTPTTCGTVVVYVDGLTEGEQNNIGTLYCYYCVELVNFRGISNGSLQRLTQIASQNLTTIGAPSLTPPTVITEDENITAIEVNAQDTTLNSLVDGYQLENSPKVGDSYVVATTANLTTDTNPTIRVRSSDGTIIPANYYKLTSNDSMIKNYQNINTAKLLLYDKDKPNSVDLNAGIIDLFFTGITFVKNVADAIGNVAKVIIEVIKPYTTVLNSNAASAELVDQFSAITKGNEMEISLPDVAIQDFSDTINSSFSIFVNKPTGPSDATIIRSSFPNRTGHEFNPNLVNYVYTIGSTDSTILVTDINPPTALPNLSTTDSVKFVLPFTDINNIFKIGKTFNVYTSFTSSEGSSTTLPLGIISDKSVNIYPFPPQAEAFVNNFSVLAESTAPNFYELHIDLDTEALSDMKSMGSDSFALNIAISDITEVDRSFAIPEVASIGRRRKLN